MPMLTTSKPACPAQRKIITRLPGSRWKSRNDSGIGTEQDGIAFLACEGGMMKIGVVIMLVELKDLGRALTFREIRATASHCEELGFDSIWVYDHLLYRMKK